MASARDGSYVQKLQSALLCSSGYCATNQIAQPQFQDYSDPRGIRTAWSSGVVVQGREFRASLWRDYRYLEHSREEAAEIAWKTLTGVPVTTASPTSQYTYSRGYTTAR
ncbi:hypothetical protein DM02DRAFT_639651 [Periconia macrospinosa]|uniref:Uncharacterized protein n=1 Tax=Periconia macrospinosa TaxID=97972 RepID=A0A2V1E380_9PLEO|nr:hypothetical protein DM02DRAFT_639651 [Periconia macrospinosa]